MMGTRIRLAAVLCLALAPGIRAQTPAPAPAPAGIQPAPAVVTVLSTGTGEKRAVRYKVAPGAQDRIELTMKATLSVDVPDAGPQTMDAPPVKMAMDIDVTGVAANGDIALTMAIVSASMEGSDAGVLDMLKDLTASLVMTDRGMVKSMTMDESKLVDPVMKQVLTSMGFERLSAPLPAEPVGLGAKWEVAQAMDANGMRVDQKTVFEVVAMDAGSTTFALSMTQTAPPQRIAPPSMPGDVNVNLISMSGEGSGRMALPDGSVALVGDMVIKSKVVMEMTTEGINQRMATATDMKMTVARATSVRRP